MCPWQSGRLQLIVDQYIRNVMGSNPIGHQKGDFEMIGNAINGLVVLFFIQIPLSILGIWKLIEIIVYLFNNIHITFG